MEEGIRERKERGTRMRENERSERVVSLNTEDSGFLLFLQQAEVISTLKKVILRFPGLHKILVFFKQFSQVRLGQESRF